MANIPGSTSADFIIPSGGNNYLGGGGNDTYLLTSLMAAGTTAQITDTEGTNVIQLNDGLTIKSSLFTNNAVELTLSNDAKVQVLGANNMTFQVGANATASPPDTATSQTYTEFATALGTTVPAAGATATSGTPNFVVPSTSTPTTPTVSFASATASRAEGNSGTANLAFTVNLSAAQTSAVTVNYATANGTGTNGALAGSDYAATSGTLTFAVGETTKTVNVPIMGDTTFEGDETFTFTLSSPSTGASLGTISAATGTITNDDTNLSPVNAVPTSVNAVAGQSVTLAGFSVNDADNNIVTVTLATPNSVISIPAATPQSAVTANNSASVTLNGSLTQVNADLATLKFTSGLTGAGTQSLTVTTTDPNGAVDTDTVAVNVSQALLLTPADETLTGGSADDSFTESSANAAADFQAADSISGGLGTDTLILVAGDTSPINAASRITGVEIYDISAGTQAAGTVAIDATGNAEFSQVILRDGDTTTDNGFTITAFGTGDTVSIPNALATAADLTVGTGGASVAAATVTLGTSVNLDVLTFTNGPTTLTVNTGASGVNEIASLALTTAATVNNIAVNGSAGLKITAALSTAADFGTITGGAGNDSISVASNTSTVVFVGGAGNDVLTGGNLADTITGGTGADTLTGGTGDDKFIFAQGDGGNTSTTRDTLGDLNAGDIIDLSSASFANLVIANGVIGTNAGTKAANGTVEVYTDTTNGFLVVETSDTGSAVTYEQIVLPTAFKSAPFTSASELLTVGTPALTAVNDNAGTLTLAGQAIGAAPAVITNLSTPPTVNAAVIGINAVVNVNAADVTGFGINISANAATTGGTYAGSALADMILGGTGADTITGGLGADTIIPGSGTDTIVLTETTAAVDTIKIGTSDNSGTNLAVASQGLETITDFGTTTDDVLEFDIGGVVVTNTTQKVATLSADGATLTSLANTAAAGDVDIVFVLGTHASYTAVQTILNATAGTITDATNGAVVFWTSSATGNTTATFDTDISVGAGTGTSLVSLAGVATSALAAANVDVVA